MLAIMLAVMLAPGLAMRGEDGSPSTVVVVVVVVVVELTLSLSRDDGGVRMPYWVPGAAIAGIAVDRRVFSGAGGEVGLDDDE